MLPDSSLTPKGKLFLVPVPLSPGNTDSLPETVRQKATTLQYYFVENIRTARRFLKSLDKSVDIDAIAFSEINQHVPADTKLLQQWLRAGYEIGLMSEAGCPGVADPGSALVAKAQEINARVIPLVGPNSMLLALMASGFNGQGFRFSGYLPVKEPERGKAIKILENLSAQHNETQICIETPYRNNQLFRELVRHCKPSTKLCIAVDITAAEEYIATKTIAAWEKEPPELHKRPAVFLIMA
jgi:16S rRNA (cytidine1402-2'-O)-methyltransferase